MKFWCTAMCAAVVMAGSGLVQAFDDSAALFNDDDIPLVLTPARLRQPVSQVPASVTVIDRELIEATGAREVYQLLQLVPGMSAVKVDGNVPTVAYHGTQSRDVRRMLVLIDGRSQYLPGLARVMWNDFPLDIADIERIEVTRGPAAAAYGANAFQGVINIVTRHPQDVTGTRIATRQGNNGVNDWRVTSASRSDTVASRVTVSSLQDGGYSEPFRGEPRRDNKSVQSVNLRSHLELGERDTLDFLAGGSRRTLDLPVERSDFEEFTDFIDLPENRSEEAFAQLRWRRQVSDRHEMKVQAYSQYKRTEDELSGCFVAPGLETIPEAGALLFSREMRELFEANMRDLDATEAALGLALTSPPGDPSLTPEQAAVQSRFGFLVGNSTGALCGQLQPLIIERRQDLEVENTLQVTSRARLVVGANVRLDEGESETYVDGAVRNLSQRLFGNLELNPLDSLFLNGGGYWERDELNGTYFSPRAAAIWQFHPGHSLRLVYSEAVRTMDIYEKEADIHITPQNLSGVYGADPLATLGWAEPEFFATQSSDGRLRAEKIRSRELGYFARIGAFEWDLRVFQERLDDLVSGPINPQRFRPDNDARVRIQGAEVQLAWRPHPRHLVRLAGADIRTRAEHPLISSVRIERALAADVLASGLWRYDVTERWMVATNWFYADDWEDGRRKHVYQRGDLQLRYRIPGRHGDIELSALVQRLMRDDPVVRRNNLYSEDSLYWLSAVIAF